MPIAITITQIQENTDGVEVFGFLTFTGNYVQGGDTLDWTTVIGAFSPNGRQFVQSSPAGKCLACQINGSDGRDFAWIQGAQLNLDKVKVLIAVDTELGAGAYPAGILNDVNIVFDAAFPKLL